MKAKERAEIKNNGATYQQIADDCGISRQAVQIMTEQEIINILKQMIALEISMSNNGNPLYR